MFFFLRHLSIFKKSLINHKIKNTTIINQYLDDGVAGSARDRDTKYIKYENIVDFVFDIILCFFSL